MASRASRLLRDRTLWRIITSLAFALFAADFALYNAAHRPLHSDLGQVWFAARAILHGQNPYALIGPGRAFEWAAPLFYPLWSAIVAIPLAPFPEPVAAALFVGVGAFGLAWAMTEHGFGPLWGLLSICMYQAIEIAQWSPLLAAAYAFPVLSVVLIAKPTVGLAVFAAKPSKWAVVGGAALVLAAFLVQPHWVGDWRDALHAASVGQGKAFPYTAPVTYPGGFLVLLALTRWRRPEARLLAVLACVPHTMLPYEGLLLFLIPRGWKQGLALTALSWADQMFVRRLMMPNGLTETILAFGPTMTVFLYLPCTIMVLRRPNEGTVLSPWALAWLTRVHQRFVFQRRIRVLARHIAELIPADARTVLDVGCGDGTLAALVMQQRPELTITGLELAERPQTAIPVATFDGVTIPRENQSVDVVLFVDVLHHAEAVHALLHESRRVARSAVIVKDHYADPWLAHIRLWWMDWAGNAAHGVSLRTCYYKRALWDQTFHFAKLKHDTSRTRLALYPLPVRWLVESGMHFIARLTPSDA